MLLTLDDFDIVEGGYVSKQIWNSAVSLVINRPVEGFVNCECMDHLFTITPTVPHLFEGDHVYGKIVLYFFDKFYPIRTNYTDLTQLDLELK